MITFYWSPKSRAARMFWALEEVGQPYDLQHIDIRQAERDDPPGFVAASPLRKVPALTDSHNDSHNDSHKDSHNDGDVNVADSAAVMLYLADRYAAGVLAPRPDEAARGEFLTWLFYTPSVLEPAMIEKFAKLPANPAAYAWGSFDKAIAALETRLQHRQWLAADRFTVADLMVSGAIQFMVDFKMLDPSALLKGYVERCFSRPAAVRAQQKEAAATAAIES